MGKYQTNQVTEREDNFDNKNFDESSARCQKMAGKGKNHTDLAAPENDLLARNSRKITSKSIPIKQ